MIRQQGTVERYFYEAIKPVVRRHGFDPRFVLQDGLSLRAHTIYALVGTPDPNNPREHLRELDITPVRIRLDLWDKDYLTRKGLL